MTTVLTTTTTAVSSPEPTPTAVHAGSIPAWRYHAVFTESPFEFIQAEEQHRDHAIVEQVFADWNDGPTRLWYLLRFRVVADSVS